MNTQKIKNPAPQGSKPRRGRAPLNACTEVVDALGPVPPEAVIQDSCLRAYLQLGSIRAVASSLGISVGLAHRHVTEASAHLRNVATPEHRAAVLGLVEHRLCLLWEALRGALQLSVGSGQVDKIAGLVGAGVRCCEILARLHGVGAECASGMGLPSVRLAEVMERIRATGAHSKASLLKPCSVAESGRGGQQP
jgi:hypothetical protein